MAPGGGTTVVFDDLQAEEDRLDAVLDGLDADTWAHPSAAPGWTVADVVLHLAQSEEIIEAAMATPGVSLRGDGGAGDLDAIMDERVRAERAEPGLVLDRWRRARSRSLALLRAADPDATIPWATNPLRPTTLATTRLAEHWAHGLDITGPLAVPWVDTPRLRHVAWLAHRSLPYAVGLAGEPPTPVRCELTGPDGDRWDLGPPEAPTRITGPAGDFCRVGARRLAPEASRLVASGPGADRALALLRNYAV